MGDTSCNHTFVACKARPRASRVIGRRKKSTLTPIFPGAMIGIILIQSIAIAASELPSRASLDKIWEQHMLEGTFVVITLEESGTKGGQEYPPPNVEPKNNEPTFPSGMTHPISIQKLGEGLFGNGGWVLGGGLLQRVKDGSSTFELYGKKVVRRFSYIPFPPHRDLPQEVSYEFFLLHRNPDVSNTQIIRKWTFPVEDVIQKNPNYPSVRITFKYDKPMQTAIIKFSGLKKPVEERLDLSSAVKPPPR